MLSLKSKTDELFNVGEKTKERLKKLGIEKIQDFLFYFPVRYNDYSHIKKTIEAKIGEEAVFKGKIAGIKNRPSKFGRKTITEAILQDDFGSLKVVWFNQPFLPRALKVGSPVVLAGKVDYDYFRKSRVLLSPEYELLHGEAVHTGRIVPVYHETKGISSKWLRSKIKPLLRLKDGIKDHLPDEVLDKIDLISLPEAIKQIHFPDFAEALKQAKKRLAFDELFIFSLYGLSKKGKIKNKKSPKITFDETATKKFVDSLPFKLTNAQKKAAWEILRDMQGDPEKKYASPMCRLLNGDVGSGKTVVAAIVALNVALCGFRVLFMAPTEVLAYQHFETIQKLFKGFDLKIALYTRSYKKTSGKEKDPFKCQIIIGTHALIEDKVEIEKVALSIVDEQHRFGVRQRQKLKRKGKGLMPHLLSMTATPIPRTMSIAIFGDLDVSLLDELPKERKEIISKLVPPKKREAAYEFIKRQVNSGRQIFVVCPLIEESDVLGIKSVEKEHKKLSEKIFPGLKIGLLHGKMKAREKETIMKLFSRGRIDILVSTSVVEVGVDIPNASIMMVEGAERFGLSQLHQFRGRVGRGKHQSYFFLFATFFNQKIKNRLLTIVRFKNGFDVAKADLKFRGPGEIYGTRQSGIPDLKMASFFDYKVIKLAREEAERILRKNLSLSIWPLLKKKVESFAEQEHLE